MTKTIHIHLHARDGEFKESDHPRADNGEFGSGGASSAGAVTMASKKRVKDPEQGTHTEVKLSNGKTFRIQRLNSLESMGVPGWHDIDADQYGYLADSEEDAIKRLIERTAKASKEKA